MNINYINLNLKSEDIGIDWKNDTLDKGDHLNIKGAIKTTNYLSAYLKKLGIFENKKQDYSYKQWNQAAKKFEKSLKK